MIPKSKIVSAKPKKDVVASRTGILTVAGIAQESMRVLIIGDAPLICNRFGEKARKQITDKQQGEASGGREPKNPLELFEAARYRLADGSDGIPAGGVKAAIVAATGKDVGVPTTRSRGGIRVTPDDRASNLCRILSANPPRMVEHLVRNATGVVDTRYRPQYWPWAMLLNIEWLRAIASARQILQAVQMAGYRIGFCEWRPSSQKSLSGSLGTFRIAEQVEIEAFEDNRLWQCLEEQGVVPFVDPEMLQAAE